MKDANEILFVLKHDQYSLLQLYDTLPLKRNTIRGRLHEMYEKGLVRKIHGKFAITDNGLKELEKDDVKEYNFIITKNGNSTKIYTENREHAHVTAKLLYGTDYEVNNIGTN